MYWIEPWTPMVGREITAGGYRFEIVYKDRQALGGLTYDDAKAEGHGSIDNAKVSWVRDHDEGWIARHKVYLAEALGPNVVRAMLCERFDTRWADEQVWVIALQPAATRPQFMARISGLTASPGLSIDPDAEVPGDAWVERFARNAQAPAIAARAELRRADQTARAATEARRRPMRRNQTSLEDAA
jgi:hypothetical protein